MGELQQPRNQNGPTTKRVISAKINFQKLDKLLKVTSTTKVFFAKK